MTEPHDVFSADGERLPAEPLRVHEFEHGADGRRQGQRRALGWALALNIALLITEVAGGVVFGSLALLADAAHLVSDVAAIAIALGDPPHQERCQHVSLSGPFQGEDQAAVRIGATTGAGVAVDTDGAPPCWQIT